MKRDDLVKIRKYSIRKVKIGAVSALIGTLFLGSVSVLPSNILAQEESDTTVANKELVENLSTTVLDDTISTVPTLTKEDNDTTVATSKDTESVEVLSNPTTETDVNEPETQELLPTIEEVVTNSNSTLETEDFDETDIQAVTYSTASDADLKSLTSEPLAEQATVNDYKLSIITKEVEETIGNEVATIKFRVATDSIHDQLSAKIVYADQPNNIKLDNITKDYFNKDGEVILSLANLKSGERFYVELHDGKTNKTIRSEETITILTKNEVDYTPSISPTDIIETASDEKVTVSITIPQWHVDKEDYLVLYVKSKDKIVQYHTLEIAHNGTAKTDLSSLSAGEEIFAIAYNRNSSGQLIKSKTSTAIVVKAKPGKPDTQNETPEQDKPQSEPSQVKQAIENAKQAVAKQIEAIKKTIQSEKSLTVEEKESNKNSLDTFYKEFVDSLEQQEEGEKPTEEQELKRIKAIRDYAVDTLTDFKFEARIKAAAKESLTKQATLSKESIRSIKDASDTQKEQASLRIDQLVTEFFKRIELASTNDDVEAERVEGLSQIQKVTINDVPMPPSKPDVQPKEPQNETPDKPKEPQVEDLASIKLQAKNTIKEAVIAEKEEIAKAVISNSLKKLYNRLAEQEATKFIDMIDQAKTKMEIDILVSAGKNKIASVFETTKEQAPQTPDKPKEPQNEAPDKPKEPQNEAPDKPKEPQNETPDKPKEPQNETPDKPKEPQNEAPDKPKEPQVEDLASIKLQAKNAIKEAVIAEKEEITKATISNNLKKLYSRLAEQEATKFVEMIDQAKTKMEIDELVSIGKTRIASVFVIKKEQRPQTENKPKDNTDTKDKGDSKTPDKNKNSQLDRSNDKNKQPQQNGSTKTDKKPATPPKGSMVKTEKQTSDSTTNTASKKDLPKTGSKYDIPMQLIGLLVGLSAIGLGSLSNRRKKHSN